MTTLGNIFVYKANDYSIYINISGDLSHSYQLIRTSSISGGTMGVGYAFNSLRDAKKGLNLARKHGYDSKQMKKLGERARSMKYRFGYLTLAEAEKYLGKEGITEAYGNVAEKYQKELK